MQQATLCIAATGGIGLAGWGVVVVYVGFIVALGCFFVKGQRDTTDYFLAGRSLGWLPVAISVLVSNLSAISYIGCVAWVYSNDLRYALEILPGPIVAATGAYLFFGLFRSLKLLTLHEYLERRFNAFTRALVSVLFLVKRLLWMCTLIYGASLTVSVVMDVPLRWSIVAVGVLSTLYTALGGMKAVVWTDVAQFVVLMVGGVAAAIAAIRGFNWDLGEMMQIARDGGKFVVPSFSLDLMEKVTWFTLLFCLPLALIESFAADQMIVQRALSTRSTKAAVRSGVATGLITLPTLLLLYFLGVLLYSYYQTHPELIAQLAALKEEGLEETANAVLPLFVVKSLPGWMAGLIVAAIFAATMSSVDSGMNSMTSVCVIDVYKRFFHKPHKTERHYLTVSRIGVVCWGAVATAAGVASAGVDLGNIIERMGTITGPFAGPVLGVFILGVLTRKANSVGTILGALLGLAATVVVIFTEKVAFTWYMSVGCYVTALSGYVLSLLGPKLGLWKGVSAEKVTPLTVFRSKATPPKQDPVT